MARLPYAALLRTVRPTKPASASTGLRSRASVDETDDDAVVEPVPVAAAPSPFAGRLDAMHAARSDALARRSTPRRKPEPREPDDRDDPDPPKAPIADAAVRTRPGADVVLDEVRVRPQPTTDGTVPGPADPATPTTSTGTFDPGVEPAPAPTSAFDPDDWSYEPASGLWYSGADQRFHTEPGGPPLPPEGAPDGVPASADLLADAVVLDDLSVDLGGDWSNAPDPITRPLGGDDVWFDADDGVFRDGGPDGAIVGFHESVLEGAVAYPNRSAREADERDRLGSRIQNFDERLDEARAGGASPDELAALEQKLAHAQQDYAEFEQTDFPYEEFPGPDLLFAGGHWYANDHGSWEQLPEGQYLDLQEVESDIGDFLMHEATLGTPLYGQGGPQEFGFVLDGATGDWHTHDPTAWDWDESSQAWVDGNGLRYDRPGGDTLGPDEVSDVGEFDSRIPLEQFSPVTAADGTALWLNAETGALTAFDAPNVPLAGPVPAGPYRYLGPTGHGAPAPLDELDAGETVYLDPTTDAFHLDGPDGPIVDFHAAADGGVAFHNRSFDETGGADDDAEAPYLDMTGPDVRFVNGTWYAHDHGAWEPMPEGRYLDLNRAQSDLGDYLNHEVGLGTPLHGQLALQETTLVIDGATGELHAFDPERWRWDETSGAWLDEQDRRHRLPEDGELLADGEVSDIGPFDSLVDMDRMALVRAADGSTYWYDLDDGTFSDATTPGVPHGAETPQGPFTVTADGPFDQPPLDTFEPGSVVWFDPDTSLYRSGGPDGPVAGFHSGADGHTYADNDGADGGEGWFQVNGRWFDAAGEELDLPANPTLADLPPGLREAVLADAGLEGAAELDLAGGLVLDGDTGTLHLFDPDAFVWDPEGSTWIDVATGEAVADPLDEEADDAGPDDTGPEPDPTGALDGFDTDRPGEDLSADDVTADEPDGVEPSVEAAEPSVEAAADLDGLQFGRGADAPDVEHVPDDVSAAPAHEAPEFFRPEVDDEVIVSFDETGAGEMDGQPTLEAAFDVDDDEPEPDDDPAFDPDPVDDIDGLE